MGFLNASVLHTSSLKGIKVPQNHHWHGRVCLGILQDKEETACCLAGGFGAERWLWGPGESCSLGSRGLGCRLPPMAWLGLDGCQREMTSPLWERAHRFAQCARNPPNPQKRLGK